MLEKALIIAGFGTAFSLFADTSQTEPWGWSNLTALGIVAVVLIFIVTEMLPSLHQKFVDQSKFFADSIREIQVESTKTLDKVYERETLKNEEIMRLREHCAKVNVGKSRGDE